jgi:protein-disulfide isomerase
VKELAVRSIRHGVVGVPTLFINGQRYAERPQPEPLAAAISAQLEAAPG